MARHFTVTLTSGTNVGPYDIYYDQINANNFAKLYGTTNNADDLTLAQVQGGVLVTVPNEASTLLLQNTNTTFGTDCPSTTVTYNIPGQPVPTATPAPTATPQPTAVPPTATPVVPTATPVVPTPTPTVPTPTVCRLMDQTPYTFGYSASSFSDACEQSVTRTVYTTGNLPFTGVVLYEDLAGCITADPGFYSNGTTYFTVDQFGEITNTTDCVAPTPVPPTVYEVGARTDTGAPFIVSACGDTCDTALLTSASTFANVGVGTIIYSNVNGTVLSGGDTWYGIANSNGSPSKVIQINNSGIVTNDSICVETPTPTPALSCFCRTIVVSESLLDDGFGNDLYYVYADCNGDLTQINLATAITPDVGDGNVYVGVCASGASNMFRYGPTGDAFVGTEGMNVITSDTVCTANRDCIPQLPTPTSTPQPTSTSAPATCTEYTVTYPSNASNQFGTWTYTCCDGTSGSLTLGWDQDGIICAQDGTNITSPQGGTLPQSTGGVCVGCGDGAGPLNCDSYYNNSGQALTGINYYDCDGNYIQDVTVELGEDICASQTPTGGGAGFLLYNGSCNGGGGAIPVPTSTPAATPVTYTYWVSAARQNVTDFCEAPGYTASTMITSAASSINTLLGQQVYDSNGDPYIGGGFGTYAFISTFQGENSLEPVTPKFVTIDEFGNVDNVGNIDCNGGGGEFINEV